MKKKSAKKKEQKNRKSFYIIIGFIIVALVLVVATIFAFKIGTKEVINDDYFVSDNRKIVLSLNDEMLALYDGEFKPDLTHFVYYYTGDKIDDAKIFFVYSDEAEANAASEAIGDEYKDWAIKKEVDGKYVIFQTGSEFYDGLTADVIKSDIESMKAAGGAL